MKRNKIKVGIIGTGNIGSDLLIKVLRSKYLSCGIFTGKNPNSPNIKRAVSMGVPTSAASIDAILNNPDSCEIVFDATSASVHKIHAPILKKLNKFVIDLTPSRVGRMCIPLLNMDACMKESNINMITCGGQAITPVAAAIMSVHPETEYMEIVSSMSSRSAGIGTRDNIDEYTRATSEAIKAFTGVKKAKAIIILNPAEPPIIMQNTIYAKIENANEKDLRKKIIKTVNKIKEYVPGYELIVGPIVERNKVTVITKVVGRGDYLPSYAGNLDIMNFAAIAVAEEYAKKMLSS